MTRNRERTAITGYYAGFGLYGRWHEWKSSHPGCLPALFENAARNLSSEGIAPSPPFACLMERIVEELEYAGLRTTHGLAAQPERVAVCFAASKNQAQQFSGDATAAAPPITCDWPGVALAQRIGATGARLAPVAACATGAHALAVGVQLIEDDYADVVVAGAVESDHTPLIMAAYRSLGALSGSGIMRPFDRRRDGFVPAAGVGCVVLEKESRARQRAATRYGRLSGWSLQADAGAPTVMCPGGDTIARAIENALRRADCPSIHYINAHGTATRLNDLTESRGIAKVFGTAVPVSSTKPLTGHLLGAAGAVEAVLCLEAMRQNYAPPTLNLDDVDDGCDLDYMPHQGRYLTINAALSLSYGFGGHIGALIFERAESC